jgi:hypothetical protein
MQKSVNGFAGFLVYCSYQSPPALRRNQMTTDRTYRKVLLKVRSRSIYITNYRNIKCTFILREADGRTVIRSNGTASVVRIDKLEDGTTSETVLATEASTYQYWIQIHLFVALLGLSGTFDVSKPDDFIKRNWNVLTS